MRSRLELDVLLGAGGVDADLEMVLSDKVRALRWRATHECPLVAHLVDVVRRGEYSCAEAVVLNLVAILKGEI